MMAARTVAKKMKKLTGRLSRIGIILLVFYFALFAWSRQVGAVEVVAASEVEYQLPYPGMLPDNPLYFLKVARDQIVGALLTDQAQKSFYFLLLADKRLGAGAALMESGKADLAAATFLKGEEYFALAVDLAVAAENSGRDVSDLAAKLVVSGAKHSELLGTYLVKGSEKETSDLAKAYQNNTDSRNRTIELLLKK